MPRKDRTRPALATGRASDPVLLASENVRELSKSQAGRQL